VKDKNFDWKYTQLGHGTYFLSANGYSWSHHEQARLSYATGLGANIFQKNDIIEVWFEKSSSKMKVTNLTRLNITFTLDIKTDEHEPLYPCFNMNNINDSIKILRGPKDQ